MTIVKFKCTLLSDIILSEKAATEGTQRTLDYIPGNVFLGIVAGQIYPQIGELDHATPEDRMRAFDLFHGKKVRFGDAHPLINETRAIRIPASWYLNKGEKLSEGKIFLFPVDNEVPKTQCRSEFIFKTDDVHFDQVKPETNFAIKSAYSKELRRSRDEAMYGYQSLEAGMDFCFEVEFEDAKLIEQVIESLVGKRTIGRSKTAQYGQVNIEVAPNYSIGFAEDQDIESERTYLYAESRLLFLDENGQPHIPMDGSYFKMNGAKVDLEKSQIRTFRYAPYNYKRQSRDADRFGIEKGSVICLKGVANDGQKAEIKKGIGLYLNEGFGKVLVNPEFLKAKETATYREAIYSFIQIEEKPLSEQESKEFKAKIEQAKENLKNDFVYAYLLKAKSKENEESKIFEKVDEFVSGHGKLFISDGNTFSSQWGTIRTKAVQAQSFTDFKEELFSDEGFLRSASRSQKWDDKGRLRKFEAFCNGLDESIALKTVVNLSSEMAKLCQKKGGKQ
jgi:hypothetical protein